MDKNLLTNIDVPTIENPDNHTWQGYIVCPACNQRFDTDEAGNAVYKLTAHLINDHKCTLADLYNNYNIDKEDALHRCMCCGTEFKLSKNAHWRLKKLEPRVIGCCPSCRTSIMHLLNTVQGFKDTAIKEKAEESIEKKYGTKHVWQKDNQVRQRMTEEAIEHTGYATNFENPEWHAKQRQKRIEKTGYGSNFEDPAWQERVAQINLEKYGARNVLAKESKIRQTVDKAYYERTGYRSNFSNPEWRAKIEQERYERTGYRYTVEDPKIIDKIKATMQKNYGCDYPWQSKEIQKTISTHRKATCLKRYGVEDVRQLYLNKATGTVSKINTMFYELLIQNGINAKLEMPIGNFRYDIVLPDFNMAIELDPSYTHSSTHPTHWAPDTVTAPNYHLTKSENAKEHGYFCMHVFDWDNWDRIVTMLKPRQLIGARKCELKQIDANTAHDFCNQYHLQGRTRSLWYAYGLYYKDQLIQVVTFGKPRYNKAYDFELLRLCTMPGYQVQGGANKLFRAFTKDIKPESVISYCDLSKFSGRVYENLGMKLLRQSKPSLHWWNWDKQSHITANLLRQRGFDQLFNTNYGKGTNNDELMMQYGYTGVYDCGQATYVL